MKIGEGRVGESAKGRAGNEASPSCPVEDAKEAVCYP